MQQERKVAGASAIMFQIENGSGLGSRTSSRDKFTCVELPLGTVNQSIDRDPKYTPFDSACAANDDSWLWSIANSLGHWHLTSEGQEQCWITTCVFQVPDLWRELLSEFQGKHVLWRGSDVCLTVPYSICYTWYLSNSCRDLSKTQKGQVSQSSLIPFKKWC